MFSMFVLPPYLHNKIINQKAFIIDKYSVSYIKNNVIQNALYFPYIYLILFFRF